MLPEIQDLHLTEDQLRNDPEAIELLQQETELYEAVAVWCAQRDPSSYGEWMFEQKQHPVHVLWQELMSTYRRLCWDAPREHGKTTQVDELRLSWELGQNPEHMAGIFSNSTEIPGRVIFHLRHIIGSEKYQRVFPRVEIVKATGDEIYLRRASKSSIHPSVVGRGVGGSIIGSRLSILILDDILDFWNTYSEGERRKMWDVLQSTILNCVVANGCIWDIGTPWHVEDCRHRLRRLPGFTYVRFDATNGRNYWLNGKVTPLPYASESTLWPETYRDPVSGLEFGFPQARLDEKRSTMPAMEFDRNFRCLASAGSMAIFKPEDIDAALECGRGFAFPAPAFTGEPVLTGVDLAISKREAADSTVFFTGSIRMLDGRMRKIPLDIRGGRWELREIVQQFLRIVRMYPGHLGFRVENNAAQDYLLQLLRDHETLRGMGWTDVELGRLRIISHTTTAANKLDPLVGVRAMSVDFEQGMWLLPCSADRIASPEVQSFVDGLMGFDPTAHTSDYVMAAWLFTEQARQYGITGDNWKRYGIA